MSCVSFLYVENIVFEIKYYILSNIYYIWYFFSLNYLIDNISYNVEYLLYNNSPCI